MIATQNNTRLQPHTEGIVPWSVPQACLILHTLASMKRRYCNDRITVFWDSDRCRHVGYCFRNLPGVFKPGKRPWVDIEAANPEDIKRVVESCPSGALTCKLKRPG